MKWLVLALTFPLKDPAHESARRHITQKIKALGAVELHEGVYVLPHSNNDEKIFNKFESEIQLSGGSAHVFLTDSDNFKVLFDPAVARRC